MASPKKLLVLDLGMQSLRLAEFSSVAGGELKLLRGTRREFLLDPALDASRPTQTRQALQEILKEWNFKKWKLKSPEVACILPAHMVFTRVIPLDIPGGARGQIDAVARFEAQQNIPFPLEEVVWDYLLMGETETGAVNVVFVAVKTDLLESLCRAISSTGLKIISISVAPLALFDSYRHANPEETGTTTLLLDIGSRTTNIVITKDGSFFSRSIPSGGLAVTMAIAKEISAELDEAEQLKITRGSVALGPGFEQPTDPVAANLARIARQTLLKTQADITRSLSYYRSTLGGSNPDRILLTGGMATLPYLAEFLTEKLQIETLFFDPFRGVSKTEAAIPFVESNPNNFGELIGGALETTSAPCSTINLLPPSVARKRSFEKRLSYIILSIIIFLSALASWYAYAVNAAALTREESGKLNSAISTETRIANRFDALINQQSNTRKTTDEFLSVIQLREAYPQILTELCAKVPERFLWITAIQPVGDAPQPRGATTKALNSPIKALVVKGLYLDNPHEATVIDDFVTALQSSSIFSVEEQTKSKIITQRSSPNGAYWAYPFALRIPLRTPITPLP